MKSLFEYINNKEKKSHPIITVAIFHYYLVYNPPFEESNGNSYFFKMTPNAISLG